MTVEVQYWNPGDLRPHEISVESGEQVRSLGEEVLAQYVAAGVMVPGLELSHEGGELSMSIAIAPFGWALIATDSDFNQHRTQADEAAEGVADVRWEEPTSIPRGWFIPTDAAVEAVSCWLADGSLDPRVRWSDDSS